MQTDLPTGEVDVNLEGWQQNLSAWYEEERAKETIVNLGVMYEASSQVFVIPSWVAQTYAIKSVSDMKDHWELFTDPQDTSKGAFYNCIAGWHCAKINRAKLDAYGLSEFYNAVSPASSAALDAALTEPQKAHRPVFGYYWTPTALMATYDWYVLTEPPYRAECWKQVLSAAEGDGGSPPAQACAYESIPIDILAHAGLREKAPEVFTMLRKMMVGLDPLNATLAWAVQNAVVDWEEAAIYYLQNFGDRWRTWVTPDAYDKINAALESSR
jgi:glycine betaine/proline transport system substrate-binding protein